MKYLWILLVLGGCAPTQLPTETCNALRPTLQTVSDYLLFNSKCSAQAPRASYEYGSVKVNGKSYNWRRRVR